MYLSDLTEIRVGYSFRSRLVSDPAGEIVVIQMKDIDDSNLLHPEQAIQVSLPGNKEGHLLQPGDLVFRSRGRTNTVALVTEDFGPAILAAPMLLIRPKAARLLPCYLHWYLNTPSTQSEIAAMAEGTSVKMISKETLLRLEIPLPPITCQQQIVEVAMLAQQEQDLLREITTRKRRATEGLLLRAARNTRRASGKGDEDGIATSTAVAIS